MVTVQQLLPTSQGRRTGRAASTFATAPLSTVDLPPLDPTRPPWPGRQVQLGGSSLYVRSTPIAAQPGATAPVGPGGAGEPALYVHGLGGSSTNWTDLAGLLAPWLDAEAVDLPGFGRSGPARDDNYSMTAMTRLLISYLDASGRGPVHLFGNSMGGLISILIAAERPDLVRTLTLISPAVPDLRVSRVRVNPLPLLLVPGLGQLAMRRLASVSPRRRAEQTIELCFGDPSNVPANRMEEAIAEVTERGSLSWASDSLLRSLRGLVASYLVLGSRGVWSRMAAISAPTLVVWGDRDKLVDVALAPKTAETIPGARLLVLPGVGHVSMMEDPVSTARAFLQLRADAAAAVSG